MSAGCTTESRASPAYRREGAASGRSPAWRRHSPPAPFFRRLDALAVQDGGGGAGQTPAGPPDLLAESIVDRLPSAVLAPLIVLLEDRAFGGKLPREHRPLAAGAGDVEDGVEHLPQVGRARA